MTAPSEVIQSIDSRILAFGSCEPVVFKVDADKCCSSYFSSQFCAFGNGLLLVSKQCSYNKYYKW